MVPLLLYCLPVWWLLCVLFPGVFGGGGIVAPVVGVGQVELADPCMLLVIGEPSWETRFGSTFLLLVVLLPFLVLY